MNNRKELTFKHKPGVFFWRNILIPLIAAIGGKKYPRGKVLEFAYGTLKNEKLDFTRINTLPPLFIVGAAHGFSALEKDLTN